MTTEPPATESVELGKVTTDASSVLSLYKTSVPEAQKPKRPIFMLTKMYYDPRSSSQRQPQWERPVSVYLIDNIEQVIDILTKGYPDDKDYYLAIEPEDKLFEITESTLEFFRHKQYDSFTIAGFKKQVEPVDVPSVAILSWFKNPFDHN